MGYMMDVTRGLATHMASQDPFHFRYAPGYSPPFDDTPAPIYAGRIPHDVDLAVGLTPYNVEDISGLNHDILGVQARFRGLPHNMASTLDLVDAMFDLVQDYEGTVARQSYVVLAWRQASGPIGVDENDRYEWADSYYLRVARPGTRE